jgi:hypothetical protein
MERMWSVTHDGKNIIVRDSVSRREIYITQKDVCVVTSSDELRYIDGVGYPRFGYHVCVPLDGKTKPKITGGIIPPE